MLVEYLIIYFSLVLTAFAHLLLKIGVSVDPTVTGLKKYCHPYIISGYILMILAVVMNIRGLRHVPLRDLAFILPFIYVLVPMLSAIFLKERMTYSKVKGTLLIIIGSIIFNIPIKIL